MSQATTELLSAARDGDVANVRRLLAECQVAVNVTDKSGCSPLHMASFKGHLDTVKTLIEARANVNQATKGGWSSLHEASLQGHLDIVKTLIEAGANVNQTSETVKKLISTGDDPNLSLLNYRAMPLPWCGVSPAELLMGRRLRTMVPQIREWFMPGWPYVKEFKTKNRAYKEKQKEIYDRSHRVKSRADMEDGTLVWVSNPVGERSQGQVVAPANTPRSYVVETPTGEVGRNSSHLVPRVDGSPQNADNEAGHASSDHSNQSTSNGHASHSTEQAPRVCSPIAARLWTGTKIQPPINATPLYVASEKGHHDVVQSLLEAGADVNMPKSDRQINTTPLYVASEKGHHDVVQSLLRAGAEVNIAKSDNGSSPLHIASFNGHLDVVRTLIEAGANISQVNTTFKAMKVTCTVLKKRRRCKAKSDAAFQHLDIKAQNAWLLANIFDTSGNYLYCAASIVCVLGVWVKRLARLRKGHRVGISSPVYYFDAMFSSFRAPDKKDQTYETKHGQTAMNVAVQKGHNDIIEVLKTDQSKISAQQLHYMRQQKEQIEQQLRDILKQTEQQLHDVRKQKEQTEQQLHDMKQQKEQTEQQLRDMRQQKELTEQQLKEQINVSEKRLQIITKLQLKNKSLKHDLHEMVQKADTGQITQTTNFLDCNPKTSIISRNSSDDDEEDL
ncbi:hypothetical protein EMCRGX_G006033 [Ephydatia muelleri]